MEAEDRQSYLYRRGKEARALSKKAADDRVRAVHLEMAIRYEVLAENYGQPGLSDNKFSDDDGGASVCAS